MFKYQILISESTIEMVGYTSTSQPIRKTKERGDPSGLSPGVLQSSSPVHSRENHPKADAAGLATCNGTVNPDRGMHPNGFSIVELIGTCLLLSILFSMTIPMLLLIARERRSTEQRQFALQHAANLLENAVTRDWSDLMPGELPIPVADEDLQAVLPSLERTLVVKQPAGESDSRQITASIRWQNRAGELVAPLRLSAWVHPVKEVP